MYQGIEFSQAAMLFPGDGAARRTVDQFAKCLVLLNDITQGGLGKCNLSMNRMQPGPRFGVDCGILQTSRNTITSTATALTLAIITTCSLLICYMR